MAKPSKKDTPKSPAENPEFALHSLQEEFEKNKRYDATAEQLRQFYGQTEHSAITAMQKTMMTAKPRKSECP